MKYLNSIVFLFLLIIFSPNNLPKSVCSFPFHFFILQRTLHLKIFYSYDVLFSCQPGFLSLSALFNSFAFLSYSEFYVFENLISLKLRFKQGSLMSLVYESVYISSIWKMCTLLFKSQMCPSFGQDRIHFLQYSGRGHGQTIMLFDTILHQLPGAGTGDSLISGSI